VERVQKYKPDANEALLNKAYVYAMQKHGQQKRASGDPYISHPLEVAAILTDMHLDESTIAVALLHDTIEDTTATRAEIDDLFGEDIGRLVEGLTKLKRLDLVSKKAKQAENLRKLLLAISDDVRVLLVKLADRLHNMRTLEHMKAEQKARISEETMDIYAPLAGRMGMQDMRDELEDLSFRYMNPEAYETVTRRLDDLSARNEGLIKKIEDELRELLVANGLPDAVAKGRQKKPYSIFRKMQSKSLSFEQLSDLYGFRIVVGDIPSCYRALGIVHTRWRVVPGRFKDYISNPKQNDYRSIHTTIVGPSRQRIELQVRTQLMQEIAEYGIAAHALYKDGQTGEKGGGELLPRESNAYSWLRHTIESLAEGDNPEEFLEHTKLELFQDQVFCFTPKGKLIALPRGATPIDFAYAVHTNIGDTTVGAKINGRIMPLVTRLNNGDEVEIIRSGVQVPPAAWEEIVVTGKARSAIRRATRVAIRKQYTGLGHRILERTFERAGKIFTRENLKPALHRLAHKDVEDAIAAVGRGELSSLDVLRAVYPDYKDERITVKPAADEGWFNMRSATGMMFKLPDQPKVVLQGAAGEGDLEPLPIRGLSANMEVRFAPNGAVPGDRIVGIMERDKGITIYPIQASALQRYDDQPERWIDVRWDLDQANKSRFPAHIFVNTLNEPGTLATVAQTIARLDINIRQMSMGSSRAADFSELDMEVEVWDLRHLNQLLSQLKDLDCVSTVKRLYD
jgi:guanosine-3',5'-bis(diphosphate) 3'-pyrophosphohydrolase